MATPPFDASAVTQGIDLRALAGDAGGGADYLQPFIERAAGRVAKFRPITPEERFRGFAHFGFRPYGTFVPDDPDIAAESLKYVHEVVGIIPEEDQRLRAYYAYQDTTAEWERAGLPGRWSGQMGVSRSTARFRAVGCGRRWGKSELAAHEALSAVWQRPRSMVWAAAPTDDLVVRVFEIIVQKLRDYRIPIQSLNNTQQNRRAVLKNGAIIEGMSLESWATAGASVDYVIVDEASLIDQDTWERDLRPPLLDRNGQALLISSFSGDENMFYEIYSDAQRRGSEIDFEAFTGRSSENFYWAPQGEATPRLQLEKRSMSRRNYLELYGGVAARAKLLVYPEFHAAVHTGRYPFDPAHPVVLLADPSGGAEDYAVVAFQNYPDLRRVHAIDEVCIKSITEDVIDAVQRRAWCANVAEVVVDSAIPAEAERWQRHGFNAAPLFQKPLPEESYPIVRRLLRDPVRYNRYHERILAHLLAGRGLTLDDYEALEPGLQHEIEIDLDEYLANPRLPTEDIAELRACATLRIDSEHCPTTIDQHRRLAYIPAKGGRSSNEKARKFYDHCTDCTRYMAWHLYRWDGELDNARAIAIRDTPVEQPDPQADEHPIAERARERVGFLEAVRRYHEHPQRRMIPVKG